MERMPGDTSVLPIPASEKDLVRNLMQAYRHDLSEFDGASPDESGSYGVGSYFDAYWTEPVRYPFKVLVGDVLAGFALVRELAPQTYSMAEFFILRRHRGSGVGREAAFALFRKFPGTWHVAEDEHNLPAQRFWRSVVGEYSGGDFAEEWSELQPRGPKQVFATGGVETERDFRRAAVIVCDMWDAHHCVSAADRVAEMAPRMNEVLAGLREQGYLIIHAPSGCMDFYDATPGRRLASRAPHADAPVDLAWNPWDSGHESALPPGMADPGSCSCGSPEPCCEDPTPYPWTRQIESIHIDVEDAISDDGQEVFNLLQQRGINDVVLMGVHTNICVLGRPFGIRQLVYLGKKPVLCRDLTDSFHRDERGHFRGTDLIVEHIERFWCPTITSDQLVGGAPFQFEGS